MGIVQHADGIAEVGGRNAYLTPEICYRLYRLAYKDDEGAFSQTARAIAVLAHEAWHLHGETDEGITNCYAFQSGVSLGRRLGLSEGTAARMMRQQLADNATYGRSAPEYLVPSECRTAAGSTSTPAAAGSRDLVQTRQAPQLRGGGRWASWQATARDMAGPGPHTSHADMAGPGPHTSHADMAGPGPRGNEPLMSSGARGRAVRRPRRRASQAVRVGCGYRPSRRPISDGPGLCGAR